MEPTERFAALMRGPDDEVPLDEAALLIAAHARPDLDVARWLKELDELAAGVQAPTLDGVLDHLYGTCGFGGNQVDMGDPDGSFLDQVLTRRVGIPISLAVVLMEVARRIGVPVVGVGMPGHFLVQASEPDGRFVDPVAGAVVSRQQCERIFHRLHPPGVTFDDSMLDPVGPKVIVARMLLNLRQRYLQVQDARALTWVLRLRTSIPGVPRAELGQLASALAALGRYDEAADVLDELTPDVKPDQQDLLRGKAAALRAKLN